MTLRFRRSFKVLPGIRLNLSKRGVSTSIGVRGAHVTLGRTGVRTTVGIPGTGLSATELHAGASHHLPAAKPRWDVVRVVMWILIAMIAAGVVVAYRAG